MRPALYVITGPPGCGKTTTIRLISEKLRTMGLPVGGMLTTEVRRSGLRVGFDIIDISSGYSVPLARIGEEQPRLGKYSVYVSNIDDLGVRSILQAVSSQSVVLIDEVGPMELMSQKFVDAVEKALSESMTAVITVHFTSRHRLAEKVRKNATRLIQLRRGVPRHELDKIVAEICQEIETRFRKDVHGI